MRKYSTERKELSLFSTLLCLNLCPSLPFHSVFLSKTRFPGKKKGGGIFLCGKSDLRPESQNKKTSSCHPFSATQNSPNPCWKATKQSRYSWVKTAKRLCITAKTPRGRESLPRGVRVAIPHCCTCSSFIYAQLASHQHRNRKHPLTQNVKLNTNSRYFTHFIPPSTFPIATE